MGNSLNPKERKSGTNTNKPYRSKHNRMACNVFSLLHKTLSAVRLSQISNNVQGVVSDFLSVPVNNDQSLSFFVNTNYGWFTDSFSAVQDDLQVHAII